VKGEAKILIIEVGVGTKFKYAKAWGVLCLKPEWITDSKRAGHVVPTEKYIVHTSMNPENLVSTQIETRKNVPCRKPIVVSDCLSL
jgi:hypothetical protein